MSPANRPTGGIVALSALLVLAAATSFVAAEDGDASISGLLTDAAGRPLAGVEVTLIPVDYHGLRAVATSGDDGVFRVETVRPGGYRIRFGSTDRVPRGLDAAGFSGDGAADWERQGVVAGDELPEIPIGAGQTVRIDVLLVAPGTEVSESWVGPLDRLTELVQRGRCDEAVSGLQAHLEGFPLRAKAHYLLGFCQASLGRTDEGVAALERALTLNPAIPGAALLLGQVLLQAGRTEEATTWLRREAEQGADPRLRVEAWTALGFLERDRGRAEQAIEAFSMVVELAPERNVAYSELVELHAAQGDADRALEVLAAGRQSGPVDLGPLLNIVITRMNDRQYEAAHGILERALELATTNESRAMVYALLGRCRLGQQRRDEGLAALRKSLELDADGRFAEECRRILGDAEG